MESDIREKVKERYGEIASKVARDSKANSCCGTSSCGCGAAASPIGYTAQELSGLPADAVTASLGCANPFVFAQLKEGETVLDLGSGGGIDVLAASKYVGKSGKVYGLDMTDEMLALANSNKARMGAKNVEFLKGFIEDIPLPDGSTDAIISNCVINLSEDKGKALSEAYRVLKKGGRIAVADMVSLKNIPQQIRDQAELWSGCIAGTLDVGEYERLLKKAGFHDIEISPVNIYTRSAIEDMITDGDFSPDAISGIGLDYLDGAFAGAHIKAVK